MINRVSNSSNICNARESIELKIKLYRIINMIFYLLVKLTNNNIGDIKTAIFFFNR